MIQQLKDNRQSITRWLNSLFFLVLLVFAVLYIRAQWSQLDPDMLREQWPRLLLSLVLFAAGIALLPVGSWLILRWRGYHLSVYSVWRVFYLSQIAKYLPGSIWSLPSRAILYQQQQISVLESGVIVLLEVFCMCSGALLVGVLSLPLIAPVLSGDILAMMAVGAVMLAILLVVLLRQIRARWENLWKALSHLSAVQLGLLIAVYALNWVWLGAAFAVLSTAFIPDMTLSTALQLIGLHSIAWLIGFLVIITPGGIGVRDAILAFGLLNFTLQPVPVMISLLARIAWTLSEVIGVVVLFVVNGLKVKS